MTKKSQALHTALSDGSHESIAVDILYNVQSLQNTSWRGNETPSTHWSHTKQPPRECPRSSPADHQAVQGNQNLDKGKNGSRNVREPDFKLGDKATINNVNRKKGFNPKLQAQRVGPYYIADVDATNHTYLLRDCSTQKQLKWRVNAKRLHHYHSEDNRLIQPPTQDDVANTTQATIPMACDEDIPIANWLTHKVTSLKRKTLVTPRQRMPMMSVRTRMPPSLLPKPPISQIPEKFSEYLNVQTLQRPKVVLY